MPTGFVLDAPPGGKLSSVSRAGLEKVEAWQSAFQSQRKDRRYYELVEKTICPDFTFRYFLIEDENGRVRAVQPFFLLDQDLLAGVNSGWQQIVRRVRRIWPGFLKLRTLMVGCAAGEGHLSSRAAAAQRRDAEILSTHLVRLAREEGASLIVLKEFPACYRSALSCFPARGFVRIPSMPMTRLDLSPYSSFDDYLSKAIKSKRRTEFRKKFKASEESGPIEMEVASDASPFIEEIYPLYLQVFERSELKFEKLTMEFFVEIGKRMPDKVKFFLWRLQGKIIAFSLCLVEGDTLYGEYIGFDYAIALKIHLYFYTMRDMISWAIAGGYTSIISSGLSYAPKLQMRHVLEPLDLYVRHTSPMLNPILKRVLPFLEPTRADETLRQFPNYADLFPGKA